MISLCRRITSWLTILTAMQEVQQAYDNWLVCCARLTRICHVVVELTTSHQCACWQLCLTVSVMYQHCNDVVSVDCSRVNTTVYRRTVQYSTVQYSVSIYCCEIGRHSQTSRSMTSRTCSHRRVMSVTVIGQLMSVVLLTTVGVMTTLSRGKSCSQTNVMNGQHLFVDETYRQEYVRSKVLQASSNL